MHGRLAEDGPALKTRLSSSTMACWMIHLVLGSDGGKRLQAGVIDGERHGEPQTGEIGGHSPWEASPPGGKQRNKGASITAAAVIVRNQDARRTGLAVSAGVAP